MIEVLRKNSLINSFKVLDNLQCILACTTSFLCTTAIVDSSICNVYSRIQITDSNTVYSPSGTIYIKNGYNQANNYLIHYWPFNGNYMNVITKAYLFNGKNYGLVKDRFGRLSSSLYLSKGQLQAPNDFYIYGDFTVTTWVKMYMLEGLIRFLTLSTPSCGVIISFTYNQNTGPYYRSLNGDQVANTSLTIGKWQHLAFTSKGSNLSIYIDAILVYTGVTTPIGFGNQLNVFFGTDGHIWTKAELDDIKIFNKSLSQTEIVQSSLENL